MYYRYEYAGTWHDWVVVSDPSISITQIGKMGNYTGFGGTADTWVIFAKYTITTFTYNYMCATIILPYGYHDSVIANLSGGHHTEAIDIDRFSARLADGSGARNLKIGIKIISETEAIYLVKPHYNFFNGSLSILNISSELNSFTLTPHFETTSYTDSDMSKIITI